MGRLSRRTFVLGGLGGLAVAGTAAAARSAPVGILATVPYPFKLGVASGEPDASSVVLWTRLAPSPLNSDGKGGMPASDVPVDWQVATDERFSAIVASGTVAATAASAHSVHALAQGLSPDADYFYRFRAQGHISPVGRTRTTPAAGTFGRDLVMCFASCAHFESGYYTAYRRMAEDRPDLILHLGDYMYEGAGVATALRTYAGTETLTLANYRQRYAQHKTDPDLQAAHAVAPWLVVPDDHEVENNYAGTARSGNSPAMTAAEWAARRAAAYQAYYENMPLRAAQANSGNSIALYRRVRWGQLATFHMLDTRQFRTDQACGDGSQLPSCGDGAARTLPGITQENWLLDGLGQRLGTWDILGQQVFFARKLDASGLVSMDAWDGYTASRQRLQNGWVARGVRNPVVLTGDVHRNWASDLKADYLNANSATIGTELVTTSISSGGNGSGSTTIPNPSANPHIKYTLDRRGYVRTTITPAQMRADFRSVATITEHGAPVSTARSFVILDGRPGLQAL